MYECVIFVAQPWKKFWKHALRFFFIRMKSCSAIRPAIKVNPVHYEGDNVSLNDDNSYLISGTKEGKPEIYLLKPRAQTETLKKSAKKAPCPRRYISSGGYSNVSLFTKRGLKGVNQDAMLVMKEFASQEDIIFCGVFDGHGPDGHLVSRSVRDILPQKLASSWHYQQWTAKEIPFSSSSDESETDSLSPSEADAELFDDLAGDPSLITAWKDSFMAAFKIMDRELLINDEVDCVSSGTTAVALIKQGNDLIVGNLGDSRAVLGIRTDDDSMIALQLTVDLKPDLPKEAERIRRLKGRIFASKRDPSVFRVWLPRHNRPGLAMARAFGDYCLKNHGVISEPEVSYRRLTKKDEFVVLATDGVWDVLTNEQVVHIVASVKDKSTAAKVVVDNAMKAWKTKRKNSRADDCAVVCLFL